MNTALIKKQIVVYVVKNPPSQGTQRLITVFKRTRHRNGWNEYVRSEQTSVPIQ
jgi:hypothetical protein